MGILANSVKIGVLLSAAGPVASQSAREQPRVFTMPDGRTVYVVPAQRADNRTKQTTVRPVVAQDVSTIYVVEQQTRDSRTPTPGSMAEQGKADGGRHSLQHMETLD